MIHWQGDHETPLEFVIAKNLKRRHLTASQRAVVALDALPMLEEVAKKRQISKLKQRAGSSECANLHNRRDKEISRSTTQAAELVGASPRYVSDAKKLKQEAPDLLEEVRGGKNVHSRNSSRERVLPRWH